jgi:hypothetical protein
MNAQLLRVQERKEKKELERKQKGRRENKINTICPTPTGTTTKSPAFTSKSLPGSPPNLTVAFPLYIPSAFFYI